MGNASRRWWFAFLEVGRERFLKVQERSPRLSLRGSENQPKHPNFAFLGAENWWDFISEVSEGFSNPSQ